MKIAINTRFLLKGKLEGFGWYTHEIVKRLVHDHPEHEFLFLFDRDYDKSYVFGPNVIPVVVPPPTRHPVLLYLWFEWAVPRILTRYKADVFFSPDGYCSLSTKVPTLMSMHDLAYLHYPEQINFAPRKHLEYYVPKYLRKAQKVITVSDFTKYDVLKNFDIPEEKVSTIHNGCRSGFEPVEVTIKQAIKDQYTGGEDFFFYAGAVHPRKNVSRLIEAYDLFKELTGAQIKLLIAGRLAWQTSAVKSAYDKAKHRDDIIFPGYVEDLGTLMGSAIAMVYVSLFEGFGLPILEAMNCGVPVITSELSSMPEVAGNAAILVDPTSEEEIAEAMQHLYEDIELRGQLIAKGHQQKHKFDWDHAAQQVWDELMSIAGDKNEVVENDY